MTSVVLEPAGDAAFMARYFEPPAGPEREAAVLAACARLDRDRPAGVLDVVPGPNGLLVTFDPIVGGSGPADPDVIAAWIESVLADSTAGLVAPAPRTVDIPVVYDARVAPDLEALAAEKGLTVRDLVELHAAGTYRCTMLGFRPGFPYLAGLDERLHAPRLATPRLRVPAGSVGIGGAQTGIYPVASPGGWRIIGRTPLRLFDADRADPFAVHPGDCVRFVPVDPASATASFPELA